MKRFGLILASLVALAALALELDPFTKPTPALTPEAPQQRQLDPQAEARKEAERAARRAMDAKIDAALVRLEADGIQRDDLLRYFANEVIEEADMDGLCREHQTDQGRLD